jgi:exonuclease SbcD
MRNGILHLADLHIGASPEPGLDDDYRSRLFQARESLLLSVANWIAEEKSPIGLVLIAGDLFDRHDPPPSSVSAIRAALTQIAQSIPVITLPGNHDEYSYAQCAYRRGDWPGVLVTSPEPHVVWKGQLGDKLCAVVSAVYQAGKVSPGQKLELPSRKAILGPNDSDGLLIGLFHGTLADHFPAAFVEKERCFWLSHKEAADRGYDYLALGHFHSRREWRIGPCLAHYPGPPLGSRVNDPGSGYFSLVRIVGGNPQVEAVDVGPILGCRWDFYETEVQPEQSHQDIADQIVAHYGQVKGSENIVIFPAVKLKGHTTRSDLVKRVQDDLQARGMRCCVVTEGLEQVFPANVESLAAEESLVGHFVRQWKSWREKDQTDCDDAMAVLYEGLLALGWHQTGHGE